jgi:hypothetical protein
MWNRTLELSILCTSLSDNQTKVEIKSQKSTNGGLMSMSHDKGITRDFFEALTQRLRETGGL